MAPPEYAPISTFQYSCNDPSKQFEVHNPATGAVITKVQAGDATTAEAAIKASQEAFESWRWRPAAERGALMLKCADKLDAHKEELAELLCLENGKPAQDALLMDLGHLINVFRYFGSLVDKLPTEFYDRGSTYVAVFREPHGVCAGILPFNWPPIHTGGKTAPCLAAGNTMILKPGEQAPLTVLRIVALLNTVLPPGVLQAVPGLGPEVPQMLTTHPLVKMISFTGSTAGGAAVAKSASAHVKPTVLELGGKNAFLVFEDADLDRAARYALEGAFFNKGEACTAASRLLIHESIYDKFVSRLGAAVKKLKVGDGMDKSTHVGPCVSKAQQERVLRYLETAKKEGATVAAQAPVPSDPKYKDGFFVPATLFRDVQRTHTVARDEVFGPAAFAIPFSSEDDALSIANASVYGLTAIVFTQNSERGMRVARKLETGMVWVNNYMRNVLGLPYGGVKESGYGREHCIETLREWSACKFVQIPSGLEGVGSGMGLREWRANREVFAEGGGEGVNGTA
ncbi:MAG: hypothetical protein Q9227_006165 [Pyrenula ochraceoflavens]